jgi:two-component system, sensor histidine kinase and response regulator
VNILTAREQAPPFDLVLMDLQMPEMDGLTATKLLRAAPRLQKLPIIAMTAHAMAEEVHQCLEAGMNDHVAKPIDRDAFFATITRWMPARERAISDIAVAASELGLLEIEGVNVSGALQRVSGNVRLLRELLLQFATKQADTAAEIAAALKRGDSGLAERRAHTLKGAAGNLGIEAIFHCAGKLEYAIRHSLNDVPVLLAKLSQLLDRQVQTLHEALNIPITIHEDVPARNISDPSAMLTAIVDLRALLETNDAGAPIAYATLAQALASTVDATQLDALGACVRDFDFDGALLRLQEITKKHEATWHDESGREKGSAASG